MNRIFLRYSVILCIAVFAFLFVNLYYGSVIAQDSEEKITQSTVASQNLKPTDIPPSTLIPTNPPTATLIATNPPTVPPVPTITVIPTIPPTVTPLPTQITIPTETPTTIPSATYTPVVEVEATAEVVPPSVEVEATAEVVPPSVEVEATAEIVSLTEEIEVTTEVTPPTEEVEIDSEETIEEDQTVIASALKPPVLNRYTTSMPTFTWTEISWAANYEIQIDDDNRFRSVDYSSGLIASSFLSHTVTAPLSNGVWYWRVRALDTFGDSGSWTKGKFKVEA